MGTFCKAHYNSWKRGYIRGFTLTRGNKDIWVYCDHPNVSYAYKTIRYNFRNKNLYIDEVNLKKMKRCRSCGKDVIFYINEDVNPILEEIRDRIHYNGFGQIC